MLEARIRLAVAALLFCGWIGWLAYLAATTTHPVILSRPQLLVAQAHVVARLTGQGNHPDQTVTVENVLWTDGKQENLAGTKLTLSDLKEHAAVQGWAGPGDYLLPIKKAPDGTYRIALIPHSPGYPPPNITPDDRRLIYLATPQVLRQYEQIRARWSE